MINKKSEGACLPVIEELIQGALKGKRRSDTVADQSRVYVDKIFNDMSLLGIEPSVNEAKMIAILTSLVSDVALSVLEFVAIDGDDDDEKDHSEDCPRCEYHISEIEHLNKEIKDHECPKCEGLTRERDELKCCGNCLNYWVVPQLGINSYQCIINNEKHASRNSACEKWTVDNRPKEGGEIA